MHQRTASAFSPGHYSPSNGRFSPHADFLHGKQRSVNTATKESIAFPHVRDSHPIPLFSRNKNACPFGTAGAACAASASVRVAHLPQKPVIDSFFIFVYTFPRETTKKTAVSQAVRIHHIHLVFIHGCFHVFDKYPPKSAAERASCRCNRNLLFVRLPFRIDVCFCPREIFTSKR